MALLSALTIGCKFPYPADVPDDDVSPTSFSVGGKVAGLWTGGAITIRLTAGAVVEDLAVNATDPFTFAARLPLDTSYLVTIADDGPDHDCVVTNGSGMIEGTNITDLAVSCTNLIPHGIAISVPAAFTFDPRITRYPLAVSILQQETTVVVSGETLTAAMVAGQPVTLGRPSAIVPIGQGQTTVPVVVTKGPWSQRYDLVFDRGGASIVEALYGRANNAGLGDRFGTAVAGAGDYVAVGAWGEDSSSELVNDDTVTDSGAVYIYRRSGQTWAQTQFLKGSRITSSRYFGGSVAMDKNTLAVGAYNDDERAADAGAVYVFRLDATTGQWVEQQRITASDPHATDRFGGSVSVSGDRIAVSARGHDAGSANSNVGMVYVYKRTGNDWSEETRVRQANPQSGDQFGVPRLNGDTLAVTYNRGISVSRWSGLSWVPETVPAEAHGSLDLEGDVLAVGQSDDASGNGQPGDTSAPNAGVVRVFTRSGSTWTQTGYLKATTPQAGGFLGKIVAIRGNTIAATTDIGSAIQVFQRVGGSWVAAPPVAASGPPIAVYFGTEIALTNNAVVVTAENDTGAGAGAVQLSGTAWFFR